MTEQSLKDISTYIKSSLGKLVLNKTLTGGELTIKVKREAIKQVMRFLRDDATCSFKMLVFICGADYPERDERFEIVYHLLSTKHNMRITVKIAAGEDTHIDSVAGIFRAANWYEREIWDMYGVFFKDHPDLRRILTDYGFEGHPLRKDFPLTGFVETRYDEDEKRVVYEPVLLRQAYRSFDFESPWEGMTDIQRLGDDKNVVQSYGAAKRKEEKG